jgi:hypothetical protein
MAAPNILLKERPRCICYQDWMLGFALCDIVRANLVGRLAAAGARTLKAFIAWDEPLGRGKSVGRLLKLPFPLRRFNHEETYSLNILP